MYDPQQYFFLDTGNPLRIHVSFRGCTPWLIRPDPHTSKCLFSEKNSKLSPFINSLADNAKSSFCQIQQRAGCSHQQPAGWCCQPNQSDYLVECSDFAAVILFPPGSEKKRCGLELRIRVCGMSWEMPGKALLLKLPTFCLHLILKIPGH